ncbi:MAG: glycosyltransferase family 2 protein [Bacteroidaceae bacterium]|nr:glycosyltransferase family 2 protein [Bacteroidaceae bacterium]
MKIIAVVVTYNRLPLLQKNIACLRQQKPLTAIMVVNNGSTDGTAEWLQEQPDLTVVTQANVGGSGGFYTGIDLAYKEGADWIWCMDDDVFPRPDCLEQLLQHADEAGIGILAPRRLMEGQVYTNDFQAYNLTNPLASMYQQKLKKQVVNAPTQIAGTAFEGPFIRREVVERIGLPNKDFFIFCDDTDYCLRTFQAGFRLLYVPTALMDKQRFFSNDSWGERHRKKKWKHFYQVRNSTYMNHHYGHNWAVRYLRGFIGMSGYVLTAPFTVPFSEGYSWHDIPRFWQAYRDGLAERLGKM